MWSIAVDHQGKVIESQDAELDTLKLDNKLLQEVLEQDNAWYKKSEIVGPLLFVMGVGLGAYVTRGR